MAQTGKRLRGRPAESHVPEIGFSVRPDLKRQLMAEADTAHVSLGRYVARIIMALDSEQRVQLAIHGWNEDDE